MSRIGKKPILIPEGVAVKIEGRNVKVSGPKGELARDFRPEVEFSVVDDKLLVKLSQENTKENRMFWGTARALLNNMVKGVKDGFEKKLQIEGIGFKAVVANKNLELFVGFTNPIKVEALEGINFLVEKNVITVSGIDLEKVSRMAAEIKKAKKPEPYKGAGIRYLGEQVRRKVGKKAVATTK